jgi:hypothetical protein
MKLRSLKMGAIGMAILRNRSLLIAVASLLVNLYRRNTGKVPT